MKGDFTRNSFKKDKNYTSVRMQQGRVQLDADWNEQVDIVNNRIETQGIDIIGLSGGHKQYSNAPEADPGFKITVESNKIKILAARDANEDLKIGHYYVDGVLCEIVNDYLYTEQPNFPDATLPEYPGFYIAYLDVWQRHITANEDPSLREEALGSADTTTRTKTIWQVKLLKITESLQKKPCDQSFQAWNELINRQARLAAVVVSASSLSTDICAVSAQTSVQIATNQLYRVEIHTPGPVGTAQFKWSHDNGSIVGAIESFNETANSIGISMPSRDDVQNFEAEQWVELIDEILELTDGAGIMVKLTAPTIGTTLTYDPDTATGSIPYNRWKTEADREKYKPRVRRWDHKNSATIITSTNWIDLEDGIQVHFGEEGKDIYQIGDYWLIPARAISRNVEWPIDETTGTPKLEERHGIEHHYCRLAIVNLTDGNWEQPKEDCRKLFPSLTTICAEDVCMKPDYCEKALQQEAPPPWSEIKNAQQAFDKICYNLYKCNAFLGHLRGDGILRGPDGNLGFAITLGEEQAEIKYGPGIAFVNGCRFEINGDTKKLDESMTHQILVVDDNGEVILIKKDPPPARYAPLWIISTYQKEPQTELEIRRIVDIRFDLTNLDKKVEQNFHRISTARSDRRQFVPLLSQSIKGLQYRDGRNVIFDLSQTNPKFVGTPSYLVSDREKIWVANSADNIIARIPREATDSSEIETIDLKAKLALKTGTAQSWAVAYDGCCLWFTLQQLNSVVRIDPQGNNEILQIAVGLNPLGIAFDGDFIWVCNYDSNSISIVDVETCQVVRTFLLINPDTGQAAHPDSIVFDGTHVWIAGAPNMLFKVEKPWGDPEMVTDKLNYEQGCLVFDGSHIWVSSQNDHLIKFEIDAEIDRTKNNIERLFDDIPSTHAIAFDGTYIWAFQQTGVQFALHKIDPAINKVLGSINLEKAISAIYAAIFDGTHLWISTDQGVLKRLV